jgi:hypothetical protein
MNLFVPARFKTSIQLAPSELAELGVSFEKTLLDKLKATHENICTRFGYVRHGSLKIIKRSAGNFIKQHFNGYIKFELLCRAEVCNPVKNNVYEAVVRNKNALGVHAEALVDGISVLDIIIPKRAAGIQSEIALDELQNDDVVYVKVLCKKYQLNDRFISIIGSAVKKPGTGEIRAEDTGALTEGEFAEAGEGEGEGAELAGGEESEPDDSEDDDDLTSSGNGDDSDDDASKDGSEPPGSVLGRDGDVDADPYDTPVKKLVVAPSVPGVGGADAGADEDEYDAGDDDEYGSDDDSEGGSDGEGNFFRD